MAYKAHVTFPHSLFCHFFTFSSATVNQMFHTSFQSNPEHRRWCFLSKLSQPDRRKQRDETLNCFICRHENVMDWFHSLTSGQIICLLRFFHWHACSCWPKQIAFISMRQCFPAANMDPSLQLSPTRPQIWSRAAERSSSIWQPHCLSSVLTAEKRQLWIFPWAAVEILHYNQRRCKVRIYVTATPFPSPYWKWKSINIGVSVAVAGAPFPHLWRLFSEKRRGQRCGFCFNLLFHISNPMVWQVKCAAAVCKTICTALVKCLPSKMSECRRKIHCRSRWKSRLSFFSGNVYLMQWYVFWLS